MKKSLVVCARSFTARLASLRSHSAELPLIVVFSMDRAPQLEMLLDSYKRFVEGSPQIQVLYRASNDAHLQAYTSVLSDPNYEFAVGRPESTFKEDLLGILSSSGARSVMFLVDDIVFIRSVPLASFTANRPSRSILSLRLGECIIRNFNSEGAPCPPPVTVEHFQQGNTRRMRWRWFDGDGPWGLPTSLDATVLPRGEILPIIEHSEFRAPNSLEMVLGHYRGLFKTRFAECFQQPRVVNLPLNSVKTEDFSFPSLDVDPAYLLERYRDGFRLRLANSLAGHDSTHMPWVPELIHLNDIDSTTLMSEAEASTQP